MKTLTITCLLILISFLLISNPSHAQMYWNQAASFTGTSSSYIAVKNSLSLNITGSFTLEAWVNPSSVSSTPTIMRKSNLISTYLFNIHVSGRLLLMTNGTTRLRSKTTSLIPLNQWTHVAAILDYNSSFNTSSFKIYINGQLDTSCFNVGDLTPDSNTDSLYIGGFKNIDNNFSGMMDEVRIWNRDLTSAEIADNMRISLGTNTGFYKGLIMSLPFQKPNSLPVLFFAYDYSNNSNHGNPHEITAVDLSNTPSKTISTSQYLDLPGASDYLSGPDNSSVSPTSEITLQAWIYPFSNNDAIIIHKGTPNGSTTNYSLNIINKKLAAKINGAVYGYGDTIKTFQWSHVAFTFRNTGSKPFVFYINGKKVHTGFALFSTTDIVDGTDSLYIGGSIGLPDYVGFLDEVRISKYAKLEADINDSLFIPAGSLNDVTAAYNFDGYTWCNTGFGPFLSFRNEAKFASHLHAPLNNGFGFNFQKGFILKSSDRIILGGAMMDDTLNVFLDETISDINVFVALDHSEPAELQIDLIPPQGGRIYLTDLNTPIPGSSSINTVFNDQAPAGMTNNTYTSFSSTIRSTAGILNQVNGSNSKGLWKIKINDNNPGGNSGRLYAWGIQFNNKTIHPKVLSCNALIQGFYNPVTNLMVQDTVKGYIRSTVAPYAILDSSKSVIKNNGSVTFAFNNSSGVITNAFFYYLQIKHRNSIETWSKSTTLKFETLSSQAVFDFTTDSAKAFGNNLVRVDNSPVKFAIYNGDVNQDGFVNLTDIIKVSNDGSNFMTGYVTSDLNGDNSVNLTDLVIAANNSSGFVTVVKP